ncbi:MAG: hypothetical protein HY543_07250, partial [Deltaproteobacteria bacterium]|nr:hypothetical protein [Deltaproteobacteria bacterium]
MDRIEREGLAWFAAPQLCDARIVHGFGVKDVTIEQYARAVGQAFWWPQTRQMHGAVCHAVDAVTDAPLIGDAFASATPGIVLH